jgi:thiamine-phosphate pyrophosphorylase
MNLSKRLLKKSLLYLILDRRYLSLKKNKGLFCAQELGIIQLRNKTGSRAQVLRSALFLRKIINSAKTLLIINDYVDVALAASADGVHLGQGDLSVKEARAILGPGKIIGVSCHNLAQALKAQKDGADYIGIGPIYPTPTKPGACAIGLKAAAGLKHKIKIPYFAIGNIRQGNLGGIIGAGIKRVAVCRAILKADNPLQAAKGLYQRLKT